MSLFEVPGWSVSGEPVSESQSHSKKRKRSSNDGNFKGHLPDLNIDKLVKRLKGHKSDHGASSTGNGKKDKDKNEQEQQREDKKKSISLPKPLKPATQEQPEPSTVSRLRKKDRKTRSSVESAPAMMQSSAGGDALTTMQKNMKQSLDGAKFRQGDFIALDAFRIKSRNRMINETLYKSHSGEAHEMMRDAQAFEEVMCHVSHLQDTDVN